MTKNEKNVTGTKSEATKELLYQTAMKLIDQYGYEKVTIQMICRTCEIAVGSFYKYFDSKESLLVLESRKNDEMFENKVKKELQENDPEKYIRQYFTYYADANIRIGTDLYMRTYGKKKVDMRLEQVRPMFTVLEDFLRDKQREGTVRNDFHVVTIVHFLFTAVRAIIIDWCIADGKYDLHREVQEILTPLINYYVIKDSGSRPKCSAADEKESDI